MAARGQRGSVRHRVIVKFNEPWMQAEMSAGGTIYDTTRMATNEAMEDARMIVLTKHTRSGELARKFRLDMNRRDRRNVFGIVRNLAPHADYFFHGTRGPIRASGASYLVLRDPAGTPPGVFRAHKRKYVKGQRNKEAILRTATRTGMARVRNNTKHDLIWRGLL